MSTASKVVLGLSVVLTISTVAGVHIKQNWDRQRLHEGVLRDLERVERKRENLRWCGGDPTVRRTLDGFSVTVTHSYCLPSSALPKAMEVAGGGSSSQRGGDGAAAGGGGGGAEEEEETGPGCVSASEGLEEGEVEGETLLIVEAEEEQEHDQASLDLSHDQSGDSLNSEDAAEDAETSGGGSSWSEDTTAFHCDKCHKWIPSGQLRGEQPSYLKGDNFFKFTCSDCAEDGKESFERMRLTWQQVVMLAMYNLSLEGTGRQGYFRWKEDICAFIGRHWNFLLGSRKKTSTWWSTVAGCLSVGSPTFFRSGAQEFGEPGWWKLVQNRPPTLRPDGDKTSVAALKAKEAASGSSSAGYGERSGLMVVSGGYGSGGSSSTSPTGPR
ncbi:hypothetical protein AALO_G00093200 [Alosa alosa]|uniref:Uncharacterized protein n=1 Tax=Alosa alosa TaxID=278164 RepID=A0AAV6GVU2_9TELE|nr:hypothetical protein AALO_G00093200 [Alosa alosa]